METTVCRRVATAEPGRLALSCTSFFRVGHKVDLHPCQLKKSVCIAIMSQPLLIAIPSSNELRHHEPFDPSGNDSPSAISARIQSAVHGSAAKVRPVSMRRVDCIPFRMLQHEVFPCWIFLHRLKTVGLFQRKSRWWCIDSFRDYVAINAHDCRPNLAIRIMTKSKELHSLLHVLTVALRVFHVIPFGVGNQKESDGEE